MPILEFLDRTPAAYWTVAWLTYGVLLAYVAWSSFGCSRGPGWLRSNWCFGALVGLTLLAFRWPILFYDGELNIDESFFIVAARRLAVYGGFWKNVSAGTSGPLNLYPLLALKLLGLEINYGGIRLIGLGLVFGTCFFQYLACERLFGPRAARPGMLPLLSFFAFSSFIEFVHYSSEHVSICLFSLCAYLAAGVIAGPLPRNSLRLYGVGVGAGMMPFAKLQALPLAVGYVALLTGFILVRDGKDGPGARWRSPGLLLAGLVSFPLGVLLYVLATGVFQDFINLYIVMNFSYSGVRLISPWDLLGSFGKFSGSAPGFNPYAGGGLLLVAFSAGWLDPGRKAAGLLGGVLALAVVALFVVVFPGRPTHHYLLFLSPALGLLIAVAFGIAWSEPVGETGATCWRHRVLATGLGLAGLLPQATACLADSNPILGALTGTETRAPSNIFPPNPRQHRSPVAEFIAPMVQRGEPMVQWGMMTKFFIETGMTAGTMYIDSYSLIYDSTLRDYFRERYLADIRESKPVVFVEAVGPNCREFHDRATQGYATFPRLREYIEKNYTMVAQGESALVFLRNDRYKTCNQHR
jgi:hypothetical protein